MQTKSIFLILCLLSFGFMDCTCSGGGSGNNPGPVSHCVHFDVNGGSGSMDTVSVAEGGAWQVAG